MIAAISLASEIGVGIGHGRMARTEERHIARRAVIGIRQLADAGFQS